MDDTLLQRIDGLLQSKSDQDLRRLMLAMDAGGIADAIDALDHGKRKTFALLPPEVQADVVMLLSESSIHSVLPRLPDFTVARFLHFLDEDDATDILQRFPQRRHPHILEKMKEDRRKRIEKLLTFGPETAGGLMDLNFIEVEPDATTPKIITAVQDYARQHQKQVPMVLLRGKKGMLWISSRSLISSAGHAEAEHIAQPVPVFHHAADREQVVDRMGEEGAEVACVTDDNGRIIGVIRLNDLLWIAEAEASEDVYRLGAVGPLETSYLEAKFSSIWRKRVVWLSVLFVAELFTFTALASFESSIAAVTALALFVPLTISTGGNSGSQAATLVTRAMALGDITPRDWWRVLRRELVMGLALGLALGAVAFLRASLTPQGVLGTADRWTLAFVIAQSVAAICVWGTVVGSMLPLAFRKMGIDPGYASSPFVATFVDVTGIVIYFSIANAFILG
ncbi:MAG: magnesium transporter [Candidatus Peribacteraceae bacterium]|nr:magnesium transporter [Candidatus Peribacteraceae bacterium]